MLNLTLEQIDEVLKYINYKIDELHNVNAPFNMILGVEALKLDIKIERKKIENAK